MTEETASPGTHLGTGEREEPGSPAPPLTHTQSAPGGCCLEIQAPGPLGCDCVVPGFGEWRHVPNLASTMCAGRSCDPGWAGLGWAPVVQFVGLAPVRIKNELVCFPGLWPWIAGALSWSGSCGISRSPSSGPGTCQQSSRGVWASVCSELSVCSDFPGAVHPRTSSSQRPLQHH